MEEVEGDTMKDSSNEPQSNDSQLITKVKTETIDPEEEDDEYEQEEEEEEDEEEEEFDEESSEVSSNASNDNYDYTSAMPMDIRLVRESIQDILDLSSDPQYGDTNIICHERRVVSVSKLLLLVGSQYFHYMFDECCQYDTIILPDFDKDVVEDCINYLTKGVYQSGSEDNYKQLIELLDLLGIPHWSVASKKDKSVQCKECGKILTSKYILRKHIAVMHLNPAKKVEKPKEFICDLCGLVLKNKCSLKNHISVMHIHTERTLECPVCYKKFKNKWNLKTHLIVHEEKKFICETCGFKVKSKVALASHMATHVEVRRYKCDLCPKTYNTKTFLKYHNQAAHSDERPFKCNECGKDFKLQYRLRHHQKLAHEPTKNVHCRLCSYSCKEMAKMKQHLIVHSGSKPFHCTKCPEAFKHKEEGRRHARVNHPNSNAVTRFVMNEAIARLMETAVRTDPPLGQPERRSEGGQPPPAPAAPPAPPEQEPDKFYQHNKAMQQIPGHGMSPV